MAEILCKINTDFYRKNCSSFSETRQAPWPGWKKCLDIAKDRFLRSRDCFSAFDLACGNLRWEAFLEAEFPDQALDLYAVDNCDSLASCASSLGELVTEVPSIHYQSLDIISALHKDLSLNEQLEAPLCDISVSFAFMHHVPLQKDREDILLSLIRQTKPGGIAIMSFWQFLNNPGLAEKAQANHAKALKELDLPALDEGDYLLGWKNIPGAYRYCHSFSEAEIDYLIESVREEVTVEDRFVSDGRSNNLNSYIVLRVCS